jgi:hypothetical protein
LVMAASVISMGPDPGPADPAAEAPDQRHRHQRPGRPLGPRPAPRINISSKTQGANSTTAESLQRSIHR